MDMFFTQRKLEGRIRELGEYRYRDVRNFESFLAKEDKSGLVNTGCAYRFYRLGQDLYRL